MPLNRKPSCPAELVRPTGSPPAPTASIGPKLTPQVVAAASEQPRDTAPAPEAAEPSEPVLGTHLPIGLRPPDPPLPLMHADDGDLAGLTNRSWSLLFAANTPPWLYRCGAGLAWVERDGDGRPAPRPITEDRLRHALARLADWRTGFAPKFARRGYA